VGSNPTPAAPAAVIGVVRRNQRVPSSIRRRSPIESDHQIRLVRRKDHSRTHDRARGTKTRRRSSALPSPRNHHETDDGRLPRRVGLRTMRWSRSRCCRGSGLVRTRLRYGAVAKRRREDWAICPCVLPTARWDRLRSPRRSTHGLCDSCRRIADSGYFDRAYERLHATSRYAGKTRSAPAPRLIGVFGRFRDRLRSRRRGNWQRLRCTGW
jgi:hypothetical protein